MSQFDAMNGTEPPQQEQQSLKAVSDDALTQVCRFLPAPSVGQFAATCKRLHRVLGGDAVWQPMCLQDFAVSRLEECPPGGDTDARSFRALYRQWRLAFATYDVAEVRHVKTWWTRMETWLRAHARPIHATLNPPASATAIAAAEARFEGKRSIPRTLKLLYRFHDGQRLDADESLHSGQLTAAQNVVMESIWHGLFGGVQFYNEATNVRLLPVDRMVSITLATNKARDARLRLHSLRGFGEDTVVDPNDHRVKNGGVAFAGNFLGLQEGGSLDKVFMAANVDGEDAVFCNVDGFKHCVPCCRGPGGNRLLVWLEEYLRRLEAGVYRFEPRNPTGGSSSRAISLHPLPEAALAYNRARRAAHDDDSTSSASQVDLIAVSTAVTLGVEVAVTPVLVPHRCRLKLKATDDNAMRVSGELFWTYRVRLRMLHAHPSRPPALTRCQLTRRHWEFTEPSKANEPPGRITGAGVVGLFPVLDATEKASATPVNGASPPPSAWPFAYESCTTASSYPATMGGWLEFKVLGPDPSRVVIPSHHVSVIDHDEEVEDATLRAAGTKLFRAAVETFALDVPDFIF